MAMNSNSKMRARIPAFKGIYRRNGAQDGHLAETRNMVTDAYPALTVRPGRSRFGNFENVSDCYYANGKLYVVSGGKLILDDGQPQPLCDVTEGQKQWALCNKWLVIWPDRIMVDVYTGQVRNIEESLSATIKIERSGQITAIGATQSGFIDLEYAVYSELEFGGTGWEVTGRTVYKMWVYNTCSRDSTGAFVTTGGSYAENGWVGKYFIGDKPKASEWDQSEDRTKTNPYGRITSTEELNRTETGGIGSGAEWSRVTWTLRVHYEIYPIAEDFNPENLFEVGDTVKIEATEGDHLLYNDRSYILEAVSASGLRVTGAINTAKYYTLTQDYEPGVWQVDSSHKFNVTDTLRAGQQVFMVTQPGGSGLTANTFYAYDPETETIKAYETSSQTAQYTVVFNSYNSAEPFAATIKRECPDMDYICEHGNRIYGVSNREEQKIWNSTTERYEAFQSRVLHASELGAPTRWNTFRGTAADSYSVAIGGDGDFTGICDYGGAVMAFKEYKVYKLTGEFPAEFYLRSYDYNGVKSGCHRSLCVIGQVLYYLSPAGVMAYAGSAPRLISYPLDMGYNSGAVGGRDRVHYFLGITRANGSCDFFAYDTVHGLWMMVGTDNVGAIAQRGDRSLIVIDRQLYHTDYVENEETVEWMAQLAETDENTYAKKQYSEIQMDAELWQDTIMHVLYQTDEEGSDEWHLLATVTAVEGNLWQRTGRMGGPVRKRWQFPVQNLRCDRLRLKLEGKGQATIYSLERVFSLQSDRT